MTREEAIKEYIMPALKKTWNDDRCIEIISAIEQDPCWDAISRQAVRKIIDDIRDCVSVNGYWAFLERLKKLPSVNPQKNIVNNGTMNITL